MKTTYKDSNAYIHIQTLQKTSFEHPNQYIHIQKANSVKTTFNQNNIQRFKCIHTHTNTSKNIIQSKVHSTKTTYRDSNAYAHIRNTSKNIILTLKSIQKHHSNTQINTFISSHKQIQSNIHSMKNNIIRFKCIHTHNITYKHFKKYHLNTQTNTLISIHIQIQS